MRKLARHGQNVCVGGGQQKTDGCLAAGIIRELPGIVSCVAGEMIILSAGKRD